MGDAADSAGDELELVEELLMRQHRAAAAQHQAVLSECTGNCLNCDEPLEKGRYCDEDCRVDHERRVMAHLRK